MNSSLLWPLRVVLALAVWPILGAFVSVGGAKSGVAAVEPDCLAGPSIASLGDWAVESGLEPEAGGQPPAKLSLRKGSRRISQPRPLARSSPASSSVLINGRHFGRPSLVPTVRLAAAADLPRFCRWLL